MGKVQRENSYRPPVLPRNPTPRDVANVIAGLYHMLNDQQKDLYDLLTRRQLGEIELPDTEILKLAKYKTPNRDPIIKGPVRRLLDFRDKWFKEVLQVELEDAAAGAVKNIVKLQKSEDDRVSLQASKDILDRAGVKAEESPQVVVEVNLDEKRGDILARVQRQIQQANDSDS